MNSGHQINPSWRVADVSEIVGNYDVPCNDALLLFDLRKRDPLFRHLVVLEALSYAIMFR